VALNLTWEALGEAIPLIKGVCKCAGNKAHTPLCEYRIVLIEMEKGDECFNSPER